MPYLHNADIKQREQDKKETLFHLLVSIPFIMSSFQCLLKFLLPFPDMNVLILKVNNKLIVSQHALGLQSCDLTTK